jgi:MYXO-CTERM domain-containing protein
MTKYSLLKYNETEGPAYLWTKVAGEGKKTVDRKARPHKVIEQLLYVWYTLCMDTCARDVCGNCAADETNALWLAVVMGVPTRRRRSTNGRS